MTKDFQIIDKPGKKLNFMYKRLSKESNSAEYQYIKNKIKEAPSPLEEVNNLLQYSDRILSRDVKWCTYGMWGVITILAGTMVIGGVIKGEDVVFNNIRNFFITLGISVASIIGIKSARKKVYDCNTACLMKIRFELEEEEKKRKEMYR